MEILRRFLSFYLKRIFPYIYRFRGAYRFSKILETLAEPAVSIDEEPTSIFEKEWDNLIILDACRYDIFTEVTGREGYRITKASNSQGFIRENFSEGQFKDVVYVSGNPHFYPKIFREDTNRDIDDVFADVFDTFQSDWDEENGVVMPDPLCRDALTARKLFPDKKIITHFMQPHTPYVRSDVNQSPNEIGAENNIVSELTKAQRGQISRDKVVHDYKQNLELVWDKVQDLADELEGRTFLTADHGELLGEWGRYGHYEGSKAEGLRKVPWVEI